MPRTARLVVVGYPHHITQRGNYKQKIFSNETDLRKYLSFIKYESKQYSLDLLAYCLMPNHVHFIGVPKREDSMGNVFKYAHMKYAQYYNKKMGLCGHLFQGRFYSCVMDELHTLACARYIERNPTRAKITKKPHLYNFSSAKIHCGMEKSDILGVNRLFDYIQENQETWKDFIGMPDDSGRLKNIRQKTLAGRPLGTNSFVEKLEKRLGKSLKVRPKGRPKKEDKKK